jgi:hypothetical protein
LPLSATRSYGCAILGPWFSYPDQFVLHHFFKGERWSANIRKGFLQRDNEANEDFSKFNFCF